MIKGQTCLGHVQLRTDLQSPYAMTANGKYRCCLNLIPSDTFATQEMSGAYRYWREPRYEGSKSLIYRWHTCNTFAGVPAFPEELKHGLAVLAGVYECDLLVSFRTEYLDPFIYVDQVPCIVIHLFNLEEIPEMNAFVQRVASAINRGARIWTNK